MILLGNNCRAGAEAPAGVGDQTEHSGAAAKLVDDYKWAEKYVILNRLHIVPLPGYDGAVIAQTELGRYEILRQNRAAILLQVLRQAMPRSFGCFVVLPGRT